MSPRQAQSADRIPRDARAITLHVLGAVLRDGKTVDEGLHDAPGFTALESRDRAFSQLMLLTTLRRLGQIDAVIDEFLEHPLPAGRMVVRNILRLGVCQLLFLGTPPHAAVDRMVALAAAPHLARFKGLVNAVLRRVPKEGPDAIAKQDAHRLNVPDWLWERWAAAYDPPTCQAIAAAHLETPPLDITVKADPDHWARALDAQLLPTGSLRLNEPRPVSALPGFEEGAWWVQDAAAAIPARLLGDVRGQSVVEIGAAPGGKTAQLAAAGGHVIALDRSAKRLGRLRENLSRLDLAAEITAADALDWRPASPVDAVLLDAPCSATGTIRRHPEIPWIRGPDDIERLSGDQAALLRAAGSMIKPGGLLVYAACSLQPEECERQVDSLLDSTDNFARVPLTAAEVDGLVEAITDVGDLRTLPCHWAQWGGVDGFYAARLRRNL